MTAAARVAAPSRSRLYVFCYLLLVANALPPFVAEAVRANGWATAALNLFDISAIVWLALFAGSALLWRDSGREPLRSIDLYVASAVVVAAMVPASPMSGLALSLLAAWRLAVEPRRSASARAAAIFLGLSTFLLWGRLVLALGAGPLLAADAQLVGALAGVAVEGNLVAFSDGTHFLIAPGCSSLHGLSLALILWTTAMMWSDLRISAAALWTLAGAAAASVLVNAGRMAAIAWNPRDFDFWHTGGGAQAFGWLATIVVGAVVYAGTARSPRAA